MLRLVKPFRNRFRRPNAAGPTVRLERDLDDLRQRLDDSTDARDMATRRVLDDVVARIAALEARIADLERRAQ